MSNNTTRAKSGKKGQDLADALREQEQRNKGYRERALKLFPWVCAKCGREFAGKKLAELTVHHKDHNHDNNPPDGSNWELLCIYCHDNEHSRLIESEWQDEAPAEREDGADMSHNPFAKLGSLLKDKK